MQPPDGSLGCSSGGSAEVSPYMGRRASLAAARPWGSSAQSRWCRPNPKGGRPGKGMPRAPTQCPVSDGYCACCCQKKEEGKTNGTPLGPPPLT